MRQLLAIAALTFRLPFRRAGGYLLLATVALSTALTFMVCRSDGQLVNEVMLRGRYALYVGVTTLSLMVLFMACTSMRGDLEARRLHLLTSYPVSRTLIFLGKWLGIYGFAVLGLGLVLGTTLGGAWWLVRTEPDPALRQAARESLLRVRREVLPDHNYLRLRLQREVAEQMTAMRESQQIPANLAEADLRAVLYHEAWRRWQVLAPEGTMTWLFELGEQPAPGERLTVTYRFYATDKVQPAHLRWGVGLQGQRHHEVNYTQTPPFATGEFTVSGSLVPPEGRIMVVCNNVNPSDRREFIFYHGTGVRLHYSSGSQLGNGARFVAAMLGHFAVLISVGLLLATAFTMSVACFASAVLYLVALASPFFERFLRDLALESHVSWIDGISALLIRFGMFFTTGLEPPDVVLPFSQGILIDRAHLGMNITRMVGGFILEPLALISDKVHAAIIFASGDLVLGFGLYAALVFGLGIWLLRRKELDRVH